MFKIESQCWDYTCGDGCCYEFGESIIINGETVTQNFCMESIQDIIKHVGIDVDNVSVEYNETDEDDADYDYWYDIIIDGKNVTKTDDTQTALIVILNYYDIVYSFDELPYDSCNCYISDDYLDDEE